MWVPGGHDPDNGPWVYGQIGELLLSGEAGAEVDVPHPEDLAGDE